MALGDAFVTVRADTSKFQAELVKQLKVILAALPDQKVRVTADVTAATRAIEAAAKEQARILAKANQDAINDAKRTAREIAEAETEAYKEVAAAAKKAAAEQEALAREIAETSAEASAISARASREAYAAIQAAAAQAASFQSVAAGEAAFAVRAATRDMDSAFSQFTSGATGRFQGLGSSISSFIVKPLLAAAAAGVALTAATAFFGLKMASDLQSAQVGVEGVIAAQEQYNGKLAEGQAAGQKFFDTLKATARLTPFNLQDLASASQQLVAIGLNGDQTIGVLNTLGNALATSGKVSADRLNNAVLAITQINSLGKVTRDNIRQITSNIPTFNQTEFVRQIALLDAVKERGKGATATSADLAKAQKDLQNGAVGADVGIQAILNTMLKIPGAATAMQRQMNTLSGVTSNFHDTVQQAFGAAFIPQLPKIQSELNDISGSLAGFFAQVAPGVADFIGKLGPILNEALPSFARLIDESTKAVEAFSAVALPFLPILSQGLGDVVSVLQQLTGPLQVVAGVLQFIFNLPGFGTAFGILAVGIFTTVKAVSLGIKVFKALETAMLAVRVAAVFLATEAPAVGTALTVMTGPVGIAIAAVAALGYAFYVAWNKSETFRNVVINVFNAIVTAVGASVKLQVRLMAEWARAPLQAFDTVLKGLGHVPKWLGGGVADGAAGAVESLIGHINDWEGAALSAIDNVVQAAKLVPAFADPTGLANADFGYGDNAAANITAELNKQGIYDKPDTGTTSLSGLNSNTNNSNADNKANAAAAKAKAAKEKIKAAFADLAGDLKAIGDKTSEQTAAQIKTNFNALIKDLKDSGHKSMVAGAQKIEDELIADAKRLKPLQDKIAAQLNIATPIRDNIVALGSVAQPTSGIATTFNGITNHLKLAIRNTQRFVEDIKKLQAFGLDPTFLKQLIDAGPAALDAADAILSAGQAGVTQINAQEGTLKGLGTGLANQVTPELYEAGLHAADGLISGLQSQESALAKQMDRYADIMVAAFDKKLGIHSPSTVFEARGKYSMQGLGLGIENNIAPVTNALNSVSQAMITFGPGSIAVNGGVPRPEETGQLLGQGLVSVLQQRQTQAALNGTG